MSWFCVDLRFNAQTKPTAYHDHTILINVGNPDLQPNFGKFWENQNLVTYLLHLTNRPKYLNILIFILNL
ncbi:MAG: hypothetical protein DWQ58_25410 [Microcystis aeruginosa TA09]|nr:MAG: hypothetical protein DWQ58_25410 [Microcystis aeruginosa TA09]